MNVPNDDVASSDRTLDVRSAIAVANKILFKQKVVDAFGHVSVRHPANPAHFLLARNMAPAQVSVDDILEFDENSEPVDAKGARVYLERFIHGEIYRVRPDVHAIVHSHSPSLIPFGVVRDVPLRAVTHMSGFLSGGAPVFEIRCCAGDASDLLIRSRELGASMASSLGKEAVVLMRGHGSTVVGSSLKQVVFRAVYAEVNARLQTTALQLGEPTYLTEKEAEMAATTNDGQIGRAWDMWVEEI